MKRAAWMDAEAFVVDIDGTLTAQHPVPESELVWSNPVFGVIRDVMVESGGSREEACRRIETYADDVIWWDYTGVIRELRVPAETALGRIRAWHREHLSVFADTVEVVKKLHGMGKRLFIVSNNPVSGCLFKLEVSGLAESGESAYFTRIFGTNTLRGMKSQVETWRAVVSGLEIEPGRVFTIGDNETEDGDLPVSAGLGGAFIIQREMPESVRTEGAKTFVREPGSILRLIADRQ